MTLKDYILISLLLFNSNAFANQIVVNILLLLYSSIIRTAKYLYNMVWVKYVCGRMKSDFRYSKDIVYNNFPWPENPTEKQIACIEDKAQKVLAARAAFPESSLADLYDPLLVSCVGKGTQRTRQGYGCRLSLCSICFRYSSNGVFVRAIR